MIPVQLHDRSVIEDFLRQDPYLHLYALGDLDEFFWPYTTWFADASTNEIASLFLLYSGGGLPVILALARPGQALERLRGLLQASLPLLPRRFYSHLSPGLVDVLAGGYHAEPHGRYLKMELADPGRVDSVDTSAVERFAPADAAELCRFYDSAYPGNWFDARMLETGCYFGVRRNGEIASVAGIHVYSPRYRAAALGNITTRPADRRQGLGTQVTARVCQELRKTTDTIGLNVRADNAPALAAYTRLGFRPTAEYDEYLFEA